MDTKQLNIIKPWQDFINQVGKGKKTKKALIEYVRSLLTHQTIIILSPDHLAKLVGIDYDFIFHMVKRTNKYYYNFSIPKRSGGQRIISAPYPALLSIQKWIYENILINQPLNTAAKGFIKNHSIVDNAREHLGSKCILKMDLKDFFPSITFNRVMSVFRYLGYTKYISYYLSSLCCLEGKLPQGAATSPYLSNIIAKRLDRRLSGLAVKFNLNYTRYADDLTFSGEDIPFRLISYIEEIVKEEGFETNKEKTKLIKGNKQKIVTGISISSGKLTIPKKAKREVRKNIYYITTKGLFEHQKAIKSNDPIYIERLLGYLYFWLQIDPENKYVISSIDKLKSYSKYLDEQYKDFSCDLEYYELCEE